MARPCAQLLALLLIAACAARAAVAQGPCGAAVAIACKTVSVDAVSGCAAAVAASSLATVTVTDPSYAIQSSTFTASPAGPYTVAASPTTVAVSASVVIAPTGGGASTTCPLSCSNALVTVVDAAVADASQISCGFSDASATVATVKPGPVTLTASYNGLKPNGCPVTIAVNTTAAKCERCVGSVKNGKARAKGFKCKMTVGAGGTSVRIIAGPGVGARVSYDVVAKGPAGDVTKACGLCVAQLNGACVDASWQAGTTATCVAKTPGGGHGNNNGGNNGTESGHNGGNNGHGNGNGVGRRMLDA
jgi:hypothetical protein